MTTLAVPSSLPGLVHAYIPSPDRGVWHLGPIPIRAYALCIIVGIIVAIWWGERRYVARGGRPGSVIDIAIWAVPFGLVGGRLYHVATDWWRYFGAGGDPLGALKIWDGGLGIPGAIILGGVGAWIGCRRRGIPLPFMADAVAPAIVTAQAIGRVGNYFNQELYGAPTKLPWGLELFQRVDPSTGVVDNLNGVAINHTQYSVVQPTFLYELIWDLLIALAVVLADRRLRLGHGRAFSLYVAGYAFGRFWIELMRVDPATRVFGVRINVWVMAVLFVGAVSYYIVVARRGPREDPTTFGDYEPVTDSGVDGGVESGAEGGEGDSGPAARPNEPAESAEPTESSEAPEPANAASGPPAAGAPSGSAGEDQP
ncbi:MAG TPA: prolipoprotein diacylglyceryl transferase [Pseudonocardiaceae bacterium]|nr:prolipoprotein diacylglyceryl transferase [Pseudonocardiaceae bacterium]